MLIDDLGPEDGLLFAMIRIFKRKTKEPDCEFDDGELVPKDLYAAVCGCYPGAFLNLPTEEAIYSNAHFGCKWQRPGEKWYSQSRETTDQCDMKGNQNQKNTKTFKRKSQRRGRV